MSWIDHWPSGDLCCTQEMTDSGTCPVTQVNSLIIPSSVPNIFKRSLQVEENEILNLNEVSLNLHYWFKPTLCSLIYFKMVDT